MLVEQGLEPLFRGLRPLRFRKDDRANQNLAASLLLAGAFFRTRLHRVDPHLDLTLLRSEISKDFVVRPFCHDTKTNRGSKGRASPLVGGARRAGAKPPGLPRVLRSNT